MPIGFAITAILSLAMSIACLKIASATKTCRLRWMDFLGVLDMDENRAVRKSQERQMAFLSGVLFLLFAALSASCAYWAVDEILESRRDLTSFEREMEMNRKEVEGMSQRFGKR